MPDNIPDGITRADVLEAIAAYEAGRPHDFAPSTKYDLLFEGRRFPPKAIVGLAARRHTTEPLGPYDFKGGLVSKCFRLLEDLGFEIAPKVTPKEVAFVSGRQYAVEQACSILEMPVIPSVESGYAHALWNSFLIIFCTVRSAKMGGNGKISRWDGDVFIWNSRDERPKFKRQVKTLLELGGSALIFTRKSNEQLFTFNGEGQYISEDDGFPAVYHWKATHIDKRNTITVDPTEVQDPSTFIEGAVRTTLVNAYERNPRARAACVSHFGARCAVCDFVFADFYGELGEGYIHVHHLRNLASIGEEYEVNPLEDLRPVCPNCHAMLHRVQPAMSIEALQAIIEKQQNS